MSEITLPGPDRQQPTAGFSNAAEARAMANNPDVVEISSELDPEAIGLRLENEDDRRSIYTIDDVALFLGEQSPVHGGIKSKVRELFETYPDGLKQFFVKKNQDDAVLAKHHHTEVETGGSGVETFLFTDIPLGSSVTTEQYDLGRAQGRIQADVPAGTQMRNLPETHHVIKIHGPASFVQMLESPKFHPSDLVAFDPDKWSEEDRRMIEGTLPWAKDEPDTQEAG